MKTKFLTLGLLTISNVVLAQENPLFDHLSLEAGYGYNLALNSKTATEAADMSGFKSFHVGATYHINNVWGVRGTYMNNTFEVESVKEYSLQIHKLALEATYDITEAINPNVFNQKKQGFGLVAHAGAGVSLGKPGFKNYDDDMMINAQVGLMPMYHINNNWSVFVDATYTHYMKQNYNFDSVYMDNMNGQVATFNVGVKVFLGK